MGSADRIREPVTIVAMVGGLLVLIGAIMNYYEYRGKMASTSQVPIFSFTLALIVPLLAILAHVRKAPQLFAIAVTAAFIVVSNIGFYAHFYHSLMSKGGSQWLNTVMAAAVLQMSGVLLSLAVIWKKVTPQRAPIIVNVIAAVAWFVAGCIYSIVPPEGGGLDPFHEITCFLFLAWVLTAAFKRSNSLTIALVTAQLAYVSSIVGAVGAEDAAMRIIAGYIALLAIAIHLVWFIVDMAIVVPSDSMTPKTAKDRDYIRLN